MSGITDFIGGSKRSEKFNKIKRGKTKQEQREIERKLLKPDVLPVYKGRLPGKGPVENRTIKIICETDGDVELIKKYFKVSEYKELNINNIDLLLNVLDAMEEGSLKYEEETGTVFFIGDQGQEIPV